MRIVAPSFLVVGLLGPQVALATECATFHTLENFTASKIAPKNADCSTYLAATMATGTSCHWSFPFRDTAALTISNDLWQSLSTCRPGTARGTDQPVNHPDSYALREWETPVGTYAISVKDKGALNRTLVFLRYEPKKTAP